jgi:hypothetical protein
LKENILSPDGTIDAPRDKKAHATALRKRSQLIKAKIDYDKAGTLAHDEIYIRLEGRSREMAPKTVMKYKPTGQVYETESKWPSWYPMKRVWQVLTEELRLLIHRLLVRSKVSFREGPAAMRNDFRYNMHNGDYTKGVRIIQGELSSCLNPFGQAIAIFNLNSTIAIASASVALFTAENKGTAGISHTGLLISGSLIVGLRFLQAIWTWLISITTYESVAKQDFRVLNMEQAATLFGLERRYLQLFLAIISLQEDIRACGVDNSYINIASSGVLEVSDKTLAQILYFAGYITSEVDPRRSTIAAWVPFETRLITYPSNEKIRRLFMDDDYMSLSRPGRLEWPGSIHTPERRGPTEPLSGDSTEGTSGGDPTAPSSGGSTEGISGDAQQNRHQKAQPRPLHWILVGINSSCLISFGYMVKLRSISSDSYCNSN